MIQTDQFGTSIAEALRVHSDALRQRTQEVEGGGKNTSSLFSFVFFSSSIFVVTLGRPRFASLIRSKIFWQ
jgi:hypothetical protein